MMSNETERYAPALSAYLGWAAAVLFFLFTLVGCYALAASWRSTSTVCGRAQHGDSNIMATLQPDRTAGGYSWNSAGFITGDCIEITPANPAGKVTGWDDGRPTVTTVHAGTTWDIARGAEGAWIAWTLGMVLLSFAVAALPRAIQQDGLGRGYVVSEEKETK
jgi:hypothetical protein